MCYKTFYLSADTVDMVGTLAVFAIAQKWLVKMRSTWAKCVLLNFLTIANCQKQVQTAFPFLCHAKVTVAVANIGSDHSDVLPKLVQILFGEY